MTRRCARTTSCAKWARTGDGPTMTATRARCHDHAPRVLACSLAVALLLGSPWTEEMTGMAEASAKTVGFDVTETRHDDRSIVLEYRVTNNGSEPIYLLDRPARDVHGGGMVVMDQFAHVMFAEPDIVRVVRGILPLPPDHNVARRAPTFLTKV